MDSRGRLFVGDRGNNRIKIFDQDGRLLDTWYQFSRPSGIVTAQICEQSGQLATEDCPNRRYEIFIAGTQPTQECQLHMHRIMVNDSDTGGTNNDDHENHDNHPDDHP